jgi:hypothetical protein
MEAEIEKETLIFQNAVNDAINVLENVVKDGEEEKDNVHYLVNKVLDIIGNKVEPEFEIAVYDADKYKCVLTPEAGQLNQIIVTIKILRVLTMKNLIVKMIPQSAMKQKVSEWLAYAFNYRNIKASFKVVG